MNETDLILEGVGKAAFFPPFSSRNCVQSLSPLSQDVLKRTINGTLICIAKQGHRKFQSTIHCKDKAPPAFEGIWVGVPLKVGCLQFLTQSVPQVSSQIQLERDPVVCHLHDTLGKSWTLAASKGRDIILPSGFPGGFITYRPWLMMIVKSYHLETDEWGGSAAWRLELEEE